MKQCLTAALWAVLAVSAVHGASGDQPYHFSTIDYPGAATTRLIGFNDHFDAVGHYIMPGAGQVRHAFKWSRGDFEALDPGGLLGANESAATQINNRGDISGWYTVAGARHGYVLKDGVVTTIDYPGAAFTQVNGISDRGVIFGHFRGPVAPFHGFVLEDGVFTQIDVPGAFSTFPFYINTRGDIAGEFNDRAGEIGHGYVITKHGELITFDAPGAPANSTLAIGINDRREILGYYRKPDGQLQTFIVDVDEVAVPEAYHYVTLPGRDGTPETGNNRGAFVGFYTDDAGIHGLIADPHHRPRH